MVIINIKQAALALGGDVISRNRILCPGPGHSRRDRSLQVTFKDDGFSVRSFAGDDFRDCRDHVKAALGLSDGLPPPRIDLALSVEPDRLAKRQSAGDIWERSVPIPGTLAETYLRSRGLSYQGDALRFYPGGRAMVALITDIITGEPQGIHRTFLDRDGRKIDRRMLGPAGGGVVRLSSDEDVTLGLAIAEGIETALAVPSRPVWACLSAGTMRRFPVISGIHALTVFADNDASGTGQKAARDCAERWHAAGREVTIRIPTGTGTDYATREAA
ncbi:toprim domain-containing protein [Mesorhizobium sp.]|uniref:toprim domain-containing protein n=1 Tax=Mesorhizobium sp. TaxID=1871066 RepID=UPI0025FF3061|nr:toprim domain-containing protein [Mesorhizobium sp.]